MLARLLIAGFLLHASTLAAAPPAAGQTAPSAARDVDTDPAALLRVKRIYVDSFGDDVISKELQSMVVASLTKTKRFTVTEIRDRADAVLKGVALENTSQELHSYHESTAAGQGAISDSSAHTETVKDARLSIRLVNPDGDVIWTSTQESKGAKYQGSSADVADKCVKQLLRDVERLESVSAPQAPAASTSSAAKHN